MKLILGVIIFFIVIIFGGIVSARIPVVIIDSDINTHSNTTGVYLYNDTTTHYFNETKMNETGDSRYVNIDGDNMTGNLNMTNNNISGVGTGFFTFLGSLTNRIQEIFTDTINTINLFVSNNATFTGDVDITGHLRVFNDSYFGGNINLSNHNLTNVGTGLFEYLGINLNPGELPTHRLSLRGDIELNAGRILNVTEIISGTGTMQSLLLKSQGVMGFITDPYNVNANSHFSWYINGNAEANRIMKLEEDGNLTINNWFKGKYNWTVGDDWAGFDGSEWLFNESKLSTIYYNATQSSAEIGTIDGGSLIDTQHQDGSYDGNTFNFSEEAGAPGLDLRINFTNVEDFNRGVMRYKTSSLAGDYPIIQMWNYDKSIWEDYPPVGESESFATITQPVFDSSDHIQDEVAQMRIYKASNGNTNNHYYVDWIAIAQGFGTPSGEEVDPFSVHRDGATPLTGNWNAGDYNITVTGGNWFEGLFEWFTNSIYASFNGSTLTIDDALLNTNFNQTQLILDNNDSWISTYNATYDSFLTTMNTTQNLQNLLNGTSMEFSTIFTNVLGALSNRVTKIWADEADITTINSTNLNVTGDIYLDNDTIITRTDSNKEIGIAPNNWPIVVNLA